MKTVLFRAHEWAADRCEWIQYPEQRVDTNRPAFFANSMPWWMRLGLLTFSILAITAGTLALLFVLFLVWCAFSG